MGESFVSWVLAGIAAIVAALSSAVAALYKAQISDLREQLTATREALKLAGIDHRNDTTQHEIAMEELRAETEECRKDRERINIELAKLQAKQELMEARISAVERDK